MWGGEREREKKRAASSRRATRETAAAAEKLGKAWEAGGAAAAAEARPPWGRWREDYDSVFRGVPLRSTVPEASLNHRPADPPSGEVGVSGREEIQGALGLWGRSGLGGAAGPAGSALRSGVCWGFPVSDFREKEVETKVSCFPGI